MSVTDRLFPGLIFKNQNLNALWYVLPIDKTGDKNKTHRYHIALLSWYSGPLTAQLCHPMDQCNFGHPVVLSLFQESPDDS